jgi:hypothetical protein
VLDGEIVKLETSRPQFYDLMRRSRPSFIAFDVLELNGKDVRKLPLLERKRLLGRTRHRVGGGLNDIEPCPVRVRLRLLLHLAAPPFIGDTNAWTPRAPTSVPSRWVSSRWY